MRRAGDRTILEEETRCLLDGSCCGWVNVADSQMGVLGVGNLEENPRLAKSGDDKPASGRPFEGVKDCSDVGGNDHASLGAWSCLLSLVENVVQGLVELLEAHRVGVLVSDEPLHQPKSTQIEGLAEVGGVGN